MSGVLTMLTKTVGIDDGLLGGGQALRKLYK
jgi:hypothetical protein